MFNYLKVKLTFVQMYNIGIHLGHTLMVSKFLSYWIYGGWRGDLFIINLIKTRLFLKSAIECIDSVVYHRRPIWFINLDQKQGNFINRYALLAGEPYVSYHWINGTLTNFRSILSWYKVLYTLLQTGKYKLRHRDKHKVLNYFGFLLHRRFFPGLGFVSSTKTSWKAVHEFWVLTIPCAAIVDSNILSWNISLPIPGNDDSLVCLNYYCFIIARSVLVSKSWNLLRFKNHIKGNRLDKVYSVGLKKKKLLLAYLHNRKYNYKKTLRLRVNDQHFKEINPVDKIMWEFKHLMFDMTIFSTEYSVFINSEFFKFFNSSFSDFFESNKDLNFYNDPYRIY